MSGPALRSLRGVAVLSAGLLVGALLPVATAPIAFASPAPAPTANPSASIRATPTPTASASARPTPTPTPTASAPARPTPTGSPAPGALAPAPTGRRLVLETLDLPVLTLPAGDGVRDAVRVQVRSGVGGDIDVLARSGARTVTLAEGSALTRTDPAGTAVWQRTVRVRVDRLGTGAWQLVVRRSGDHGVHAGTRVQVGSGMPTSVGLTPLQHTLYPHRDGVLDALDAVVTAKDETGTALPMSGSVRIDSGARHRTAALKAGIAHIPVTGLPLGTATVTASVRTPGGAATRTVPVVLAPTGVGSLRLAASADTVQPVVDGLLDTVTLTTSGTAAADSPARVSGSLVVSGLDGVVRRWAVPSGTPKTFSWDGRIGGVMVPGVYTVTLSLRGPEGMARSRAQNITVSKDHLPYRVRDLFGVGDGDQQGLAVHDGLFYVATDVGAGSSRIDVYDAKGVLTRTIGPLPIGHGAALSFSTTTGLLYAANGGPATPTTVWAIDTAATDATTAVKQTIDLSALGPNGMVGVDDAGGRLLVFAGVKNAYTLSAVGFDGTVQRTVPILISGTPQGMEVVGTELWVYTSLKGHNRLARYSVTNDAVIAASTGSAAFDLMNPGEGEGFAFSGVDGTMYVGAHGPNRVGVLEPVPDE